MPALPTIKQLSDLSVSNMNTHATTQVPQEATLQAYQSPVIRRFGSIGELTLSSGCNGGRDNANQGQGCNTNNPNRTRA